MDKVRKSLRVCRNCANGRDTLPFCSKPSGCRTEELENFELKPELAKEMNEADANAKAVRNLKFIHDGLKPEKEKIMAEMADYLHGLSSAGEIRYDIYSGIFDVSMDLLDKMYKLCTEGCE